MIDFQEWLHQGFWPDSRGECDTCHRGDVRLQDDYGSEPGAWQICEECFEQRILDHHSSLRREE